MWFRSSRAIHDVALFLSSPVSAFVCRPCGSLAHHSKQPPSSEVRQRSQPGKPLKHVVGASATTLADPYVCENTASRDAPQRPQSYFFPRSLLVLVPTPHAPADPSPLPLPSPTSPSLLPSPNRQFFFGVRSRQDHSIASAICPARTRSRQKNLHCHYTRRPHCPAPLATRPTTTATYAVLFPFPPIPLPPVPVPLSLSCRSVNLA